MINIADNPAVRAQLAAHAERAQPPAVIDGSDNAVAATGEQEQTVQPYPLKRLALSSGRYQVVDPEKKGNAKLSHFSEN